MSFSSEAMLELRARVSKEDSTAVMSRSDASIRGCCGVRERREGKERRKGEIDEWGGRV